MSDQIVSCRCGQRFKAASHLAGKQRPCPSCGTQIKIPAARTSAVVRCSCGKRFQAPGHLLGKRVSCPSCGNAFTANPVPAATQPPKSAQPALAETSDDFWSDISEPAVPGHTLPGPQYKPARGKPKTRPRSVPANDGPPLLSFGTRIVIGVAAGFTAVCLTLLSLLLSGREGVLPHASTGLFVIAAFCGIITVACFVRGSHPVTLRIIGGVVCLGVVIPFCNSILHGQLPPRGLLVMPLIFGIPAGYMTITGRWLQW